MAWKSGAKVMRTEEETQYPMASTSSGLPGTAIPLIRIQEARAWPALKLNELWDFRELIYFLIWRDVKVRYKQTVLGAAWAIIQPLMTMVVFTIFFGHLAKIPSDGLPYPVFSLAALVPWTYFASALGSGSTSVGGYQHIISKVYFPTRVIP